MNPEAEFLKKSFLLASYREKPDLYGLLRFTNQVVEAGHRGKIRRNGEPAVNHAHHVGNCHSYSIYRMILGKTHDVPEDGILTIQDMIDLGYPPRITTGLNYLTRRNGAGWIDARGRTTIETWREPYCDYIARLGTADLDPVTIRTGGVGDVVLIKIDDTKHNINSDLRGDYKMNAHQLEDLRIKSEITLPYLKSLSESQIAPGTPMLHFMKNFLPQKNSDFHMHILRNYSSELDMPFFPETECKVA